MGDYYSEQAALAEENAAAPQHRVPHREPRDPYRVRRWFSVGANLPHSHVRQVVEIDRKRQRVLLELECVGFDKGAVELDNAH